MIGDQDVEFKRGELSSKKHNAFNVRAIKRYVSTNTQFHAVPKANLDELRKNPRKIVRIVDIVNKGKENEKLLLMLDDTTENDPIEVSTIELKKLLPKHELVLMINRFIRNRPWFRDNVEIVS